MSCDHMFVLLPAYACFYTDPGSSMLIIQLLLSGIASAAFYFRRGLARLFFKNPEQIPAEKRK